MASAVIDLPQPDSPTRQSVSPRRDRQATRRGPHAACRRRSADVDAEAFDLEECAFMRVPPGDEGVAQAVARKVDREDEQRQAPCPGWRSARR